MRRARIERRGGQGSEQRHEFWNGIVRPRRVSGMALAALDDERAIKRAAPANLDRVAEHFGARRLADDAMIETLALVISPAQEFFGAIDRRAFLVAGDEKPDRALGQSSSRDKGAGGGGEGGNAAFHVSGAASPHRALCHLPAKGSNRQLAASPTGTTSVWPAKTRKGALVPKRA